MPTLKESLKAARKEAAHQILAEIAAVIERQPELSYRQIAREFGVGTSMVCQAAREAGLRRPRGGASPAFKKGGKNPEKQY
jgi:hypothetical protein